MWRANYAFQAVQVPAGRHELILEYRDRHFLVGCAITSAALLICLDALAAKTGTAGSCPEPAASRLREEAANQRPLEQRVILRRGTESALDVPGIADQPVGVRVAARRADDYLSNIVGRSEERGGVDLGAAVLFGFQRPVLDRASSCLRFAMHALRWLTSRVLT